MGMFNNTLLMTFLVFAAEMCVVTLGTIRIIFVSRGQKKLATSLGVFEVSLWLYAMSQIMSNLSDPWCFMAFAGGFATGNYLGVVIHDKLALGNSLVEIITRKDASELAQRLSAADFGVTRIDGHGATGPVHILRSIVKRKEVERITQIIKDFDTNAFYAVDEVQSVNQGIFPLEKLAANSNPLRVLFGRSRLHAATSSEAPVSELSS
jgi:uncharacterized protein YebE (UPF0316 family)